ncbi:tudor domain-containing protein 1-like isoform X1 [Onthophagus taurus]|uniref:tudor domain-containing protein 1-like isoform X1 n=2 Tax=Onthophagus taurus TaxID=166361 RepID=UPI0039BE2A7B
MSQCVVYVNYPPVSLIEDRQGVYNIFNKFGEIIKLFCDNEYKKFIKIYYKDPLSPSIAYEQINNKPPLFLSLTLREDKSPITKVNRNRLSSNFLNSSKLLNDSVHDSCSSTNSNMGDEEVEVSLLPTFLYDIFGDEISIFKDDNNRAFVSIDELKRHNFQLFDESKQPPPITEEDYLQELKVYLSVKVRKFQMLHRQHIITTSASSSIINEIINDYKSSKPLTPVSKQQSPSNSVTKFGNKNVRKTINGAFNDAKENNSPNIENSRRKYIVPENINVVPLPLNTPIEVSVTYGVNERRCYVYLKSRESDIRTLTRRVEIEAKKSSPVENPIVGNIYAAIYEGEWHRAIVQGVNPLKVQYIDFGNDNDFPLKEVRHLSEALCNCPWEGVCINFGTNPVPGRLEYGSILHIIALRFNTDHSYQVKKASEERHDFNRNVNFERNKVEKMNVETQFVENKNKKPVVDEEKKDENVAKIETPNRLNALNMLKQKIAGTSKEILNPPRSTILEIYNSGSGLLQYVDNIEGNHIVFTIPAAAELELEKLDSLSDVVSKNDSFQANIGDTVAVYKEEEDKWYRGTVIEKTNDSYHIALIDYGKIEITSTVYKLDKAISDIGEFCCVCVGSEKFLTEANKGHIMFEVVSKNQVQLTYSDKSKETVSCTRWDPFPKNVDKIKPKEIEPIFTKPKQMELKNGDLCKLSNFIQGKLFVKTKDCLNSYKKIMNSISEYKADKLENPKQSQIALCSYKNSKDLYRVMILNINNTQVEVEYFDLGVTNQVNINSLKTISESLATNPIPIIPITLIGYETNEFNEEEFEKIRNISESTKRFSANIVSNTPLIYDLVCDNESLTKTLKKLRKDPDRFLYEDVPKNDFTGKVNVLCFDQSNDSAVVFVNMDDESLNQLTYITEASQKFQYNEPYVPIEDEVCFANYEAEWHRARVLEANPDLDTFKVIFIDYGNVSTVSSTNIRKLNDDLKTIPNLTLICKINDLNGGTITVGNNYTISILNKDKNGTYTVNIV